MADSDEGGRNRIWTDLARRFRREPSAPEAHAAIPSETSQQRTPSFEAGDMPDAVQRRYYSQSSRWNGEPAYFSTPSAEKPAFRDRGDRLVTDNESREVVKDLIAVAQHRGWDRIQVAGSDGFRRAVWLEAIERGMEVRGYKPTQRDLQELDRITESKSRNSIEPQRDEKGRAPQQANATYPGDAILTAIDKPANANRSLPAPPEGSERLSGKALDRGLGIVAIRAGIDPEAVREANRAYAGADWAWSYSDDRHTRSRGQESVQKALTAVEKFAAKSPAHAQIASAIADNHYYDMALVGNWYVERDAREPRLLRELSPTKGKVGRDRSEAPDAATSRSGRPTETDRVKGNERAALSQLRAMDTVVRAAFPGSADTADRVMRYARHQMATHLWEGKEVKPARMKAGRDLAVSKPQHQPAPDSQSASALNPREHRPPDRQRGR